MSCPKALSGKHSGNMLSSATFHCELRIKVKSYPRGPSGMAFALRHVSMTLVPGSRTNSENEASLNNSFNSWSDMTSSASMLLW